VFHVISVEGESAILVKSLAEAQNKIRDIYLRVGKSPEDAEFLARALVREHESLGFSAVPRKLGNGRSLTLSAVVE